MVLVGLVKAFLAPDLLAVGLPAGLFAPLVLLAPPVLRAPLFLLALAVLFALAGFKDSFGLSVSCVRALFDGVLSAGIRSPLVFAGITGHIDKHER